MAEDAEQGVDNINGDGSLDGDDQPSAGADAQEADWGDALAEQANAQGGAQQESEYENAPLQDLQDDAHGPTLEQASMDIILDINVTISMEIGRAPISIRNLLQLNQGSVVELDRLAGEPLDVMVNGTLIAHGEVVVVNDKFGIRLTDVISAAERIKKLK